MRKKHEVKQNEYVPQGIKVLVIITQSMKSNKLISILNEYGVYYCNLIRGKGTANKEVLDFLGIGETEKDILFCLLDENKVGSVLDFLRNDKEFVGGRKGIAFTMALDSIASKKAIREIVREG